jgi:hypothetical protein
MYHWPPRADSREAGATVNQAMAIFGWTGPDMAIKYTREASQKRMAAERIGGLVWDEIENIYSLSAILGESDDRNRNAFNCLGFVLELTTKIKLSKQFCLDLLGRAWS